MFNPKKIRYEKINQISESSVMCAFSYYIESRRVRCPISGTVQTVAIDPVEIPCGKCPQCRTKQVNDWIYRLEKEAKQHVVSTFLTLTYNDESNTQKVSKEHLQKFFKRFRKCGYKFRYYAISEYGPKTKRPHYHVILFGVSQIAYDDILRCWGYGHIELSKLTPGRMSYVARYHISTSLTHRGGDFETFKLTSRRPGIGGDIREGLRRTNRGYVFNAKGYKIRLPRYYYPPDGLPQKSRSALVEQVMKVKSDPNYPKYIRHYENLYYKSNQKLIL